MSHAGRIAAQVAPANVKPPAASDTGAAAGSFGFFSIPEVFAGEVAQWIEHERAARPGAARPMLMLELARALGLQNERQIYRYMSGEAPLPAALLARTARILGSFRLLQVINQDAGLVAEPKPEIGKLESFDLVVEQSRTMREFGEFIAAYADQMERPLPAIEAQRLAREGREAIQQIERLIRIAENFAASRSSLA